MRLAPAVSLLFASLPCAAQIASGAVSSFGGISVQTNNPVSMVFEHKQSQTLVDGTHINIVTHEYFYRDSLGRTRTENEFVTPFFGQSAPVHSVGVQDPVAGTFTSWQTGGPEGATHQFTRIEQNTPHRPPMSTTANNGPSRTAPVPAPRAPAIPGPKSTTEQLGRQDMQGVSCDATRTTVVYPTGFMGNDRPITTVMERCQSREFGKVLLEYTEDPRTGTRSAALQSVSRGAPDPSLFQPPANYVDAKAGSR